MADELHRRPQQLRSDLTVEGNLAVTGTTTSTGAQDIAGDFSVATNKFNVTAASGNTAIAGTANVVGDLSVATNKFTVAAASGDTLVAGDLTVTGTTNKPVQRLIHLTPGADLGNSLEVVVAVTDQDGAAVAATQQILFTVRSDSMVEDVLAWSLAETGVGAEVSVSAKSSLLVTTDATGAATITITDVATGTNATVYLFATLIGDGTGLGVACAPSVTGCTFTA